ncbi:glyoxalase [Enterococcus sp. ALS3]|uniref:Glyoxalase n=2 Tax=Enterococcus alishanensis TaxID=1303817 RepID=A0ABS6TER2_9ENTE|nr:glyoxalase [Enterococcus alishanensis]
MVFTNFPVSDLQKSITFYQKLGFKLNEDMQNEQSAAMMWDDNFWVMLLSHEFYQQFIGEKKLIDTKQYNTSMTAFSMDNVAEVKQFGKLAADNGGSTFHLELGFSEEQLYQLEVEDLDGNQLQPIWMKV